MAFPDDPGDLVVEFAFGANLADDPESLTYEAVTSADPDEDYVRPPVVITRGRVIRSGKTQPTGIAFDLRDDDGILSPRNVNGPYYGRLRKNTPCRVTVDVGGGPVVRGSAYVPDWPVLWSGPDIDEHIRVQAGGIMTRLGQDDEVKSAMLRTGEFCDPVHLWTFEGIGDSPTSVRAREGGVDMTVSGTLDFSDRDAPPGSLSLPVGLIGTTGELVADLSVETYPGFQIACSHRGGDSFNGGSIIGWIGPSNTTLTVRWNLQMDASGTVQVNSFDSTNAAFLKAEATGVSTDEWHDYLIQFVAQSPTTYDVILYIDGVQVDGGLVQASGSLTRIIGVPYGPGNFGPHGLGHLGIYQHVDSIEVLRAEALFGWDGEVAADRVARNCDEEHIAHDVAAGDTQDMGPQPAGTLLAVLRECEEADEGVLVERRGGQVGFDPLETRYNQDVALALEFEQIEDLIPLDDDQELANLITVERTNGATAVAEQTTGPLSTDPSTGVDRYPLPVTRNLAEDDQTQHAAGWLRNLGTVDQPRYVVELDLIDNPDLIEDWLACDIGSRITITGAPPEHVGPDTLDLILEGYQETLDAVEWTVVLWLSPYQPYGVFEVSSGTGDTNPWAGRTQVDPRAAIRTAIDADDLSIAVDPNIFRLTENANHFNPDMRMRFGGETADVSSVATTAGAYVATGALSSSTAGSISPALYAGHAAGDWINLIVRDRSGNLLNDVPGYRLMKKLGRLHWYAKVHSGTESAPTVSELVGSGDVLSGFTFGLRNMSITLDDLADAIVGYAPLITTSAANIDYGGVWPRFHPGCLILLIAGRSDDWTSVAMPSGFTAEIFDGSTTTGSDQGLYAAYAFQTTPAVVNGGSLVVTGGGAAGNESMLLAVAAGFQTLTVPPGGRSVNGAVKSHDAGTLIEVENARVLAY